MMKIVFSSLRLVYGERVLLEVEEWNHFQHVSKNGSLSFYYFFY